MKFFQFKTILVLSVNFINVISIIINTKNGFILGRTLATLTENKQFHVFQGIPYAEPPLNNLRFRDPKPVENWDGTLNATYQKSICTQTNQSNQDILGTENCLFLNIYTPKLLNNNSNNDDNKTLATIVWIHGGGFMQGSGNLDDHGADYFIDNDVIMASLNYRVGVFGFLSTQDVAATGNWGLKDQILALKWINNNIQQFGGDPSQITIMGESAGAASVHYLIQSELTRGLFTAAIAESGNTLNPWSYAANARKLAFRIGLANFIFTFSSKNLVDALRKINYIKLQKSLFLPTLTDLFEPLNGLPYAPIKDTEAGFMNAAVTKDSYEAQKYGQFNRVPLLLGFNSLEARDLKKVPWYGVLFLIEQYNINRCLLTPKDMNASNQGTCIAGQQIESYYFQNKTINNNNSIPYVNDDGFVRGIVKSAEFHALYTTCYLYRFAYTGGITHNSFYPEGVAHAEELQYLFAFPDYIQKTPQAKLVRKRMVTMWTNFAKYSNPTPFLTDEINVRWPLVYENGSKNVNYLDINSQLVPKINPKENQMKFWGNLYDTFGYPPYNTY